MHFFPVYALLAPTHSAAPAPPASCPSRSCFDGGSYQSAGQCTLYSLDGEKPTVKQQGPETTWVSGGKTLPKLPDPRLGGQDTFASRWPQPRTLLRLLKPLWPQL